MKAQMFKDTCKRVNVSLFYFKKLDYLYSFGGQRLDTDPAHSKPVKDTEFCIQRLKLKKSDDTEYWEVLNYKDSHLPKTNLYINLISSKDFIIFGEPDRRMDKKAKQMGVFDSNSDELTDFEDNIVNLEEHGLAGCYDEWGVKYKK